MIGIFLLTGWKISAKMSEDMASRIYTGKSIEADDEV